MTAEPTTDDAPELELDPQPAEVEGTQPQPDREAAKYRRKLREAEAERDTLAERLATLQRQEVARLAGDVLAQGDDLFALGVDLGQVLDDDGNVDPARVTEAARTIAADRPGLGRPPLDLGQGVRTAATAPGPRWVDVINPQG